MVFSPGGYTEDRTEKAISGAIWALVRGWSLHMNVEHLCRPLYSLLTHVDCPKNRKSKRSALRIRCERW